MKQTVVPVALVCVLTLAGAAREAAGQSPKPPAEIRKEVVVAGNRAWTNTGIKVAPGDRVTITATGKVCFDAASHESCVGPQGWPRMTS